MDIVELAGQRLKRIMSAVKHEKPDRTPFMLNGSVAFLKYVDPKATAGDFVRDTVGSMRKVIAGIGKLNNLDMLSGAFWPGIAGSFWLSGTKLPGRDLGDDDLWQIDEKAFMTRDDYDLIITKGWKSYRDDLIFNRLGYTEEEFAYAEKVGKEIAALLKEAGYAYYSSGVMSDSVVNRLTSGRGTVNFFRDIKQIPDKLHEVIDVMLEEEMSLLAERLKTAEKGKVGIVTPAIRCTCDYVSEEVFGKFIWKTMSKPAEMMIDAGLYVYFHNDSNWDDFLHFYKQFPPKTCIYDSDGLTDIYKIKEVLGDRMCLTGNVSPALLTLGTPEQVYDFCRKQIADMGCAYILSGSCALPPNTKPENIDAMNAAAGG